MTKSQPRRISKTGLEKIAVDFAEEHRSSIFGLKGVQGRLDFAIIADALLTEKQDEEALRKLGQLYDKFLNKVELYLQRLYECEGAPCLMRPEEHELEEYPNTIKEMTDYADTEAEEWRERYQPRRR